MRKKVATIAIAASLLGGTGASLLAPQMASAKSVTVKTAAASTTAAATAPAWATAALSKLVTAGTITQAQADAISAALLAAQPAKGPGGPGGPGRGAGPVAEMKAAATALGMTEAELRTALESGKSIAELATAKGVAVQTVISAMVTAAKADLAAAVTAGRLTQAQADEISSTLVAHVTDHVNNVRPAGGPGGHGRPAGSATATA